jgi:hypothetical protein
VEDTLHGLDIAQVGFEDLTPAFILTGLPYQRGNTKVLVVVARSRLAF